jgi:hypothetical protein
MDTEAATVAVSRGREHVVMIRHQRDDLTPCAAGHGKTVQQDKR